MQSKRTRYEEEEIVMIWEDQQEIIDEMLYWQKRALQAEKEREYWKQQFNDKGNEVFELLKRLYKR